MTIVSSGQVFVVSTGIAEGLTVMSGGSVIARTGGITKGTVLSGGSEYVSSGSEATNTTVKKGGALSISSGASASETHLTRGGLETVYSGGFDSKDSINGSATQIVYGTVSGTKLQNSGSQIIYSGGIAIETHLSGGDGGTATQFIASGGEAVYTTISGNGAQIVYGSSLSATLFRAWETVMSGGTVIHTHVETGDIYVSSGGVDSQSTVTDEGYEYIWGGQSYDTKVDASSVQVLDEGIVSGATIAGLQFVYGGDAEATIVLSNGTQLLSSGRADGTIVYGTQDVSELNIAYATIANATSIEGGLMDVGSGATIIDPSLTAISGGALELGSGDIVISGAINFAVGSATLQIDTKDMPTAVISGFAPTDIISLHAVKYNSSDTTSVSGNEVSVMTPSGTYVLDIAGASNDAFQVTSGHGGTFLEIATEASTSNQSLVQLHNPAAADTQSSLTFAPNVSNSEGWGWSTMAAIDGRAPIQPGVLLSAEVGGAMAMWLDAESPSSNLVVSTDRG